MGTVHKMLKFIIAFATFIASQQTAAETFSPIVPLVLTARLTATALLPFSPAAASAAEFIIHGRTRDHIANVGNDAAQRKKRTSEAKSVQKSGKTKTRKKSGKSDTRRPPPTPQPQQRTAKPKSSKDKPTSAPSATVPPASPKIFMTINANISLSNIIVERRRHLATTSEEDIKKIMKTTIREVVKSSLDANQRLAAVIITDINEMSIDGISGSTIDSQLMLTEKCENNNCEAQLSNTTMNSTVISYMTQEIKNGNFDDIFQENADVICAETTCPQVKNGEVVGGAFNETKRGQVVVPTEAPSANPTTLTPTSSQPTAVGPSVAPLELPTAAPTNSPSSVPTKVPSANPTTKMPISSQPTTVSPSVAPLALPTAAPLEYPTYLPTEAPQDYLN